MQIEAMYRLFLIFSLLISTFGYSQIEKLDSLNSSADELNPVFSQDGKTLTFIRKFDPANSNGMRDPGDIWVSTFDEDTWSTPKRLSSPLNNSQFNGVFAFIANKKVYLYEHYQPGGGASRTQGISVADFSGNSIPSRVPVKYFYNKSDHISIAVSPDENVMLLSMESYGTIGAEDLYVSFRTGVFEWSEPENIGSVINTKFQEMTPYIAPDAKTLFFASNGHGGFGGRDIFMTQRLDDTWKNWSPPVNLGDRVNTEGVELYFYYLAESGKAIFTSTTNSDGHSDLKIVDLPESELEKILGAQLTLDVPAVPAVSNQVILENDVTEGEFILKGYVLNVSGDHIEAKLSISNPLWSQSVVANPGYQVTVPRGGVYEFIITSDGYVSKQEIIDLRTSEIKAWTHDFTLQKIEIGVIVNLENVLFVQGSTDLMESSNIALNLVVEMMKDNPGMEIQLSGHTDNQGSERLNKILSQQRVDEVIFYLESHGINKKRLSGKGLGGSQPIASNESEETRKLNRRVEFTIIAN